jgi:hypothetical protein
MSDQLMAPSPSGCRNDSIVCVRVGIAALLLAAWPFHAAWADPDFGKDVAPYFQAHCVDCHGPATQEGGFRIDTLSKLVGRENTPQWAEVIERINSGEMPPEDAFNRPSAAESAAVVEWLAERITEGEAYRLAERGRVSYNRLTRDEYVNTVRDLIGVHFDATDPGAFLEDPEWHGFERIGSVLTLSPSNIEKYLTAAEVILAEAYPDQTPEFIENTRRAVPPDHISEPHRSRLESLGLLDKVRFEMWAGDIFRYGGPQKSLTHPGIYEMTFKLSGLKPDGQRAPRLYVYETKLDRVLFEQDIIAPEDEPTTVTFRAHLPAGRPTIHVINEIPGSSNNFRANRHGRKPFISTKDGRIPWQMKLTDEQGRPRYPFLILDEVTFRGPFITEEEQRRREEYFPSEEGGIEAVRASLGRLARRAFRRPATAEEMAGYIAIVNDELQAGESFQDAVKAGMIAILCSKSFLFITEGDENIDRQELNDWEIASRLSYLLWSTMPDEELFELAEQGKLRERDELRRQFQRMMADPRAQRFSDAFAYQWLHLRKVGMFPPDRRLYPEYDNSLEQSMVAETKEFFGEVLNSGLTLREFIDSDWSMLNSRLAEFYGVPAPDGMGFHRVTLPAESHRGGLLTQASILSLTSDGTRHRPVHRGKWLSEAVFGKSPPPPPANVDPIEPNPIDGPKVTLRMRLEAHVHDARCASCHAKIDPLGLAFENYDAIGRWRTVEIVEGTGDHPPVDATGQLVDGRTFESPEQFKQLLLADLDAFNAAFIEKLATFGLRRSMSIDDKDELAAIAEVSRQRDYRVRDILEAFILSDLFQKR